MSDVIEAHEENVIYATDDDLHSATLGSWDFERAYNADYGIEDGSKIPFIHNRLELAQLLSPLYIIEDYLQSYELYDQFYEKISNIVKGCFVIRACREYPVKFKFYRTDKEVHQVQLRHFLLDLIAWRPYVELNGIHVLDETFILDPWKDTTNLDNFINEKVILPLRDHHVKPTTVNLSTSEVCCSFRKISEDYSIIMNLNFGLDTFIDIYKNEPRAREIMNARYDDLHQPYEIEERLNAYQHEFIEILKSDPDNPIGVMLCADTGIKHKQLSEFAIAEGLKPSLEGKTIPIPIENSTLIGGLDRPSYLYIDAIGARKSLVTNKKVMGNAGRLPKWPGDMVTYLRIFFNCWDLLLGLQYQSVTICNIRTISS